MIVIWSVLGLKDGHYTIVLSFCSDKIDCVKNICIALMYVILQSNIIFEGKNHQRSECNKKDYVLQELQKLSLCVVIE